MLTITVMPVHWVGTRLGHFGVSNPPAGHFFGQFSVGGRATWKAVPMMSLDMLLPLLMLLMLLLLLMMLMMLMMLHMLLLLLLDVFVAP